MVTNQEGWLTSGVVKVDLDFDVRCNRVYLSEGFEYEAFEFVVRVVLSHLGVTATADRKVVGV